METYEYQLTMYNSTCHLPNVIVQASYIDTFSLEHVFVVDTIYYKHLKH